MTDIGKVDILKLWDFVFLLYLADYNFKILKRCWQFKLKWSELAFEE